MRRTNRVLAAAVTKTAPVAVAVAAVVAVAAAVAVAVAERKVVIELAEGTGIHKEAAASTSLVFHKAK